MTAKLGLTVDRLSLTLGQNRVLDTVSMAFARGRVTVVLGPNGAGKSSLLDCLAGLRLPDAGTVQLDGIAIAALDRRTRAQRIGLLPQSADVHSELASLFAKDGKMCVTGGGNNGFPIITTERHKPDETFQFTRGRNEAIGAGKTQRFRIK